MKLACICELHSCFCQPIPSGRVDIDRLRFFVFETNFTKFQLICRSEVAFHMWFLLYFQAKQIVRSVFDLCSDQIGSLPLVSVRFGDLHMRQCAARSENIAEVHFFQPFFFFGLGMGLFFFKKSCLLVVLVV